MPPAATLNEAGEAVYSVLVPEARATVPVSAAVPVLETVKVLVVGEPTVTLPKASAVGVTAMLQTCAASS